ncbi:MAG TPA: hypothetical protein VLJ20_02055 [Acetobacteraceae bacterium]|nr:hypothetical protein [Acetobacteraceae bacterium]
MVWCRLKLSPQNTHTICIEVAPVFRGETVEPIHGLDRVGVGDADRVAEAWMGGCARLSAASPTVQTAWDRAAADWHRFTCWRARDRSGSPRRPASRTTSACSAGTR